MIDMTKYKFYHYTGKAEVDGGKDTISAASTYAGRVVKGYAKCDPRDGFSEEQGKVLAAARCNARIAEKRHARAQSKYSEAMDQLALAQARVDKMYNYMTESGAAVDEANAYVSELLAKM